jgi:hypothetical protein
MPQNLLNVDVPGYSELKPGAYAFSYESLQNECADANCAAANDGESALEAALQPYEYSGDESMCDLLCRNKVLYLALRQLQKTSIDPAGEEDMSHLYNDKLKLIGVYFCGILAIGFTIYWMLVDVNSLSVANPK